MNVKTVGIIALLVIAILAYAAFVGMRKASLPDGQVVTEDEASILADQIDAITEEMLKEIMADMEDFSASAEDDMAADLGMFMYQ